MKYIRLVQSVGVGLVHQLFLVCYTKTVFIVTKQKCICGDTEVADPRRRDLFLRLFFANRWQLHAKFPQSYENIDWTWLKKKTSLKFKEMYSWASVIDFLQYLVTVMAFHRNLTFEIRKLANVFNFTFCGTIIRILYA